ncbi:Sec-independent protein translocase protein TatA [Methylacidimicrobium cyclopophantes]|uniref:Sec-independent protein translocase protein TatA n=1 Tax=Methylacidimicrobium cyclopophantes TaxID=1041766 RepID=A0A5E6M9N7_9BACT|nr:twin-arginine translocase TatA/TatE family subunit [Methylacidimicrobium cyclopophantes]VVM05668.1 Sec-independent protein translocase protein TatA [Methylacidimicrobium cyclopophantes]
MLWLAFGLPSGSEWFWIFVVVFLLFGAKKLPELARGVGKALGEFHKAREEFEREMHDSLREPQAGSPTSSIQASSTSSPAPLPSNGALPREENKSS